MYRHPLEPQTTPPTTSTDPLSIAAAIAGILSAIKGFVDSNAQHVWENNASGKLDVIIQQNSKILCDLENLPIIFHADLISQFKNEVIIKAKSLNDAFDEYMARKPPDRGQIANIRTPAELLLYDLLQRGPSIYLSAGALADLAIAIHKMLKVSTDETKKLVTDCVTQMKIWAGQDDGMLGKATAILTTATVNAESTLAQEPRGTIPIYSEQVEVVVPGGPHGRGIHTHPILKVLADVTIDDAAPSASVTNARSTWFDSARFNDDVVASRAADWLNKLQSEVDSIKHLRALRDCAAAHLAALNRITDALSHWR